MSTQGRDTEFTLSDVTNVFEARDDYAEPLTASEIADELGCSRRTALNKLHELQEDTDLKSKKVGGRSRVWWIPVNV
jgi:MarR-like DNA-binding transcriptional regulator SgrR of sgrS sRNA